MPSYVNLIRVPDAPKLAARPADGHKGMFGRVLVVGGNEGMLGAPVFAGTAALRMGAGLVQLAVSASMLPFALSLAPELIGLGLEGEATQALGEAAEKADALVVGPGLGKSDAAVARVRFLIGLDKPTVIDADGLNILSQEGQWPQTFRARAVLTPHPGEMARLGTLLGRGKVPPDDEGRIDYAVAAARAFGQVVLLKGGRTVVTDGNRVYLNTSGDSSLSKAGTGDVLSGVLGTLLAQGLEPFDAACLGAHIHGRAGELAGQKLTRRSVLARDVIDHLGAAAIEAEGAPL